MAKTNYHYKGHFFLLKWLVIICIQTESYCSSIYKEDPDEHIGNIFLSGGMEHGSKGIELL